MDGSKLNSQSGQHAGAKLGSVSHDWEFSGRDEKQGQPLSGSIGKASLIGDTLGGHEEAQSSEEC